MALSLVEGFDKSAVGIETEESRGKGQGKLVFLQPVLQRQLFSLPADHATALKKYEARFLAVTGG